MKIPHRNNSSSDIFPQSNQTSFIMQRIILGRNLWVKYTRGKFTLGELKVYGLASHSWLKWNFMIRHIPSSGELTAFNSKRFCDAQMNMIEREASRHLSLNTGCSLWVCDTGKFRFFFPVTHKNITMVEDFVVLSYQLLKFPSKLSGISRTLSRI